MAKNAVTSIRLTDAEAARWKAHAERAGVSVSDLIRKLMNEHTAEGVELPARARGWSCDHMAVTSASGVFTKVILDCKCEMQPIY